MGFEGFSHPLKGLYRLQKGCVLCGGLGLGIRMVQGLGLMRQLQLYNGEFHGTHTIETEPIYCAL